MVIAARYDGWYAPMIEVPGKEIPVDRAGGYCAGIVTSHRRDRSIIVIDMGGGYGGPMYEHLMANEPPTHEALIRRYRGAEGTTRRSVDGGIRFTNKRSAAIWLFREALDPGQPGGSSIALPMDPRLVADLTAPTFRPTPNGVEVETKEKVCARLGRSTDRGDAVIMSWFEGPRALTNAADWMDLSSSRHGLRKMPQVLTSGRVPLSAARRRV